MICLFVWDFFWTWFTTAMEALFLNACFTNLFPSFFFPLIAKKASFFFTSCELILASFKDNFEGNFLIPDNSLKIFNFILFDKFKFFFLIEFKINCLSEKWIFLFPRSCIFSWPFPAISKISPEFKFSIAMDIALALSGISKKFLFSIPFFISLRIFLDFQILDYHQ